MLSESRLNKIISEEISKAEVNSMISSKISSEYGSRDFEKAVRSIAADVIEDLYRTLWNRSSTWKGGVKK